MYRGIISSLTKDSKLFFLYIQLNSGFGFDYMSSNHFYKVKHVSLIEIKNHLLNEYFYPFFLLIFPQKKFSL